MPFDNIVDWDNFQKNLLKDIAEEKRKKQIETFDDFMSESICRFIPNKDYNGNILNEIFVAENEKIAEKMILLRIF